MNVLTRVLKLKVRGRVADVTVHIAWPGREKNAWACKWEIKFPDRRRANVGYGVDAIQALTSALQMVGAELYCSPEHKSGRLSFDEKWIGYAFPVPNNIRDALVGDDKTYF